MISIRYNTFETNSSSTHSLAVPKKVEHIPSDVRFHFGDFGWQLEDCIDPADYLYTGIVTNSQEIREKYLPKLKEVMERNNIKAKYANYEVSSYKLEDGTSYSYVDSNYGYVDHGYELEYFLEWLFEDDDRVLRFISDGLIFTGNDNDDESSFFINRNKKDLYDCEAGENRPNPYYMENCDDYDWFYKGN